MPSKLLYLLTGTLLFALCLPLSIKQLDSRALILQAPQSKQKVDSQPVTIAAGDRVYRREGTATSICFFRPEEGNEGAIAIQSDEWRCSDEAVLFFKVAPCVGEHGTEIELQREIRGKDVESVVEFASRFLVKFSKPSLMGKAEPFLSQVNYAYIWVEENRVVGLYGPTSEHVMELYHANPAQFSLSKKQ